MNYSIADLLTYSSTNSVSLMEELREARANYDPSNPLGEQPQLSREETIVQLIPTNIMAALRNQPIAIRFTEATITRTCLRLGVSPRQTIQLTRTLRR